MLNHKYKMLKLLKQKQAVNDEFSQIKQEFDKVNDAATSFKNINTEDICIEETLFDSNDKKAVKDISKEIIDTSHAISDIVTIDDDYPIEAITIEIPSDDGIAIDAPKKVKIITTNANQMRQRKY